MGGSLFAPPDPITMSLYVAGALVVVLPVAYLLVYRRGYRRVTAA